MDGVRGSPIPLLALSAHLGRHRNQEFALQDTAELPAVAQVLQQGLTTKLDQYINGIDPGIDQVTEHEIDDSVHASERDRRFGAFAGQWVKSRTLAPGEDEGQNLELHSGPLAGRLSGAGRLARPEAPAWDEDASPASIG